MIDQWLKEFGEEHRAKIADALNWASGRDIFVTELDMRKFLTEVVTGRKHEIRGNEIVPYSEAME